MVTTKRSLENYLHPAAIAEVCGVELAVRDHDPVAELVEEACFWKRVTIAPGESLSSRSRKRPRDRTKSWLNREAVDSAQLELGFRQLGITIIYQDAIATACHRGERLDLGDLLACIIQFEEAGKDRRELAEKIILSQITLALAGYSTGGRAPYGFRRWLVRDDGTKIRELEGGERVRMRGHHVVWLPVVDDHPEMITICRILQMLSTMPATQVARTLTSAGIPTPDHGRTRKDNGIRHLTSGVSLPNDYEYCPEQAPLGLYSLWAAFHGGPAAIHSRRTTASE